MNRRLCLSAIVILIPFWTGAQPNIVSLTPDRNTLNVDRKSTITVTFDSVIDQSTINSQTIKVNGSFSGPYAATYSYSSSTNTITITPSMPFKFGELVTTTLTHGIKTATGDSLPRGYSWSFTTKTNGGSGQFVQNATPAVGDGPYSIAAGDFNRDGYIDLAVSAKRRR